MAKSPVIEIVTRYLVPKSEDSAGDIEIDNVEGYVERQYTKLFNLPRPMDLITDLREAAQLVLATQMPDQKKNWQGMFGFLLRHQDIERMCWFCRDPRYIVSPHDAKGLVGRLTFLRDVKKEVAQTIDGYFTDYKARQGLLVQPYGIDFSTPAAFKRYYMSVDTMFFGLLGNDAVAVDPDQRNFISMNVPPAPRKPQARAKPVRAKEPVGVE